ncbi:MAG TPA: hypothetical protein VGE86_04885 [Thermoanaerobaculia bacterium]
MVETSSSFEMICDDGETSREVVESRPVRVTREAESALAVPSATPKRSAPDDGSAQGEIEPVAAEDAGDDEWVTILRRTRDPKLTWVELELRRLGLGTRRLGQTFPPMLQVKTRDADTAVSFLTAPLNGTDLTLDDLDDDSSAFG